MGKRTRSLSLDLGTIRAAQAAGADDDDDPRWRLRDSRRRPFNLYDYVEHASDMSDLLDFILNHEPDFKSKNRLRSLYSDFTKLRESNPEGYQANVESWLKALTNAARAGMLPSQGAAGDLLTIHTSTELLRALTTAEYGQPVALAAVIYEAVQKKDMIPLRDFLTAKTSIYSTSWKISPWAIMSWGLRTLGLTSSSPPDRLRPDTLVILANLERAANTIVSQATSAYKSPTDLIYSPETFRAAFAHTLNPSQPLSATDLTIILTYLARDKCALTHTPTAVKFKAPSSPAGAPSPITDSDVTIASIRTLIDNLHAVIPELTAKIAALDATARDAVAAKSPTAAKSALRSKKLAERSLQRRVDTLAQLETVYARIEEATDQVAVVRVMRESAAVLKGLNKEVGGVEGVEEVVDRLRDEMGKVEEVGALINEVGAEPGVMDEESVEEEMEALEREEREKEELAKTERRLEELARWEAQREEAERKAADAERAREVERERMEKEEKEKRRLLDEEKVDRDLRRRLSSISFDASAAAAASGPARADELEQEEAGKQEGVQQVQEQETEGQRVYA